MEYDKNNIFARILRKEVPAHIVYEDEYALAFHDLYPKAPLHLLLIPKGEFISFYDFTEKASPQLIGGFSKAIQSVASTFNLHHTGFRLVSNHGKDGAQDVPHYHVHLLGGKPLGQILSPSL